MVLAFSVAQAVSVVVVVVWVWFCCCVTCRMVPWPGIEPRPHGAGTESSARSPEALAFLVFLGRLEVKAAGKEQVSFKKRGLRGFLYLGSC